MNAVAQSPWFWFPLIAVLGTVYLLPTIIGSIRNVEGLGWLVLFNVFFPGVGFLAGLILAFGLPRREPDDDVNSPGTTTIPAVLTP